MRPLPLKVAALSTLAASLLALAACRGGTVPDPDAHADAGVEAVAAFYPLQFVTKRVGGTHVNVAALTAPGIEPHDLELSPRQVADLTRTGLLVYLDGFQPAVDDAVSGMDRSKALDVSGLSPLVDHHLEEEEEDEGGHDHDHGGDPHVWLDPTRLAAIADGVAARLGELDPAHAGDYTANAASLRSELTTLDGEFAAGLETCQRRELVTAHAAFGYLADRYGLTQVAITGLNPDGEPSPRRIAEVARYAKENGITTIFFETLVNPAVAETLADEAGAKATVLDPLEGLAKDSTGDYFTVMRDNLAALKEALGCG